MCELASLLSLRRRLKHGGGPAGRVWPPDRAVFETGLPLQWHGRA